MANLGRLALEQTFALHKFIWGPNVLISYDIKYLEQKLNQISHFIDQAQSTNSAKKWENLDFYVLFGLFLLRSQK